MTFTSTATDPDTATVERLHYEWDLDGDDTYEAAGKSVTATYTTPGDVTVSHRVTDDCGASDTATQTITVGSSALFELVEKLTPTTLEASDVFGVSVAVAGDTLAGGATGDDDKGSNAGAVYVFQ